jgi:hypothetical protein
LLGANRLNRYAPVEPVCTQRGRLVKRCQTG